jgi:plastocyanin
MSSQKREIAEGPGAEDFPNFDHQIPKPNKRKKPMKTTMNTIYTTLALVKIDSWRLVLLLATAVSLVGYPKPASAATFNVTVGAFNPHTWSDDWFVPFSVTIHPGDQVQWTWASSGHSTTSVNGIWDSGGRSYGATFTHTFNTVGTFPYYCTQHHEVGQVIVMSATPTPTPTPAVITNPATKVASFSARLNGSLNAHGTTMTVYFQYGLTTSYGSSTAMQTKTGTTVQAVTASISGLTVSTTYHFRIVAHDGSSTSYGSDRTFTTLTATGSAVAATSSASFIASFSVTLNGSLDPHGLATSVHFQYGPTTSYGLTTALQSQTGNTYRNVNANIGSLAASTTYHFRIVATNSAGTTFGSDKTFTTLSLTGSPVVATNPATNVASSSATLNGLIDPHGLSTTVYFQFGTTTSYGHTTSSRSKSGSSYQDVAANISGLAASTTYHFQIVATNIGGTTFGIDRTFTTP